MEGYVEIILKSLESRVDKLKVTLIERRIAINE